MGKKTVFNSIPMLENTILGGLTNYHNSDVRISIGENIDESRGNLIEIRKDKKEETNVRVYTIEKKNEVKINSDKEKVIINETIKDVSNQSIREQERKNKVESISEYNLAQLLSDQNNFVLIEGNLYYGDQKLGYYQGVTSEIADKVIRKITPLKFKPSITSRRIHEIVKWLNSFEELIVDEEITNSKKLYINFSNCVVNATNGEIYDKSLGYCFTNYVNAEYPINFEARGDTFESFIEKITDGDRSLYKRLQEIFGYIISDIRDLKIILYFVGPKDSGKSVVINLLEELVGKEFSTNLSLHDLNEKFRLGKLYKKKLNCCGETSEINLKRTDIIKAVSGNDTILAEDKNISPFSFTNKAALLFAGNDLPRIVGLDKTRAFSDRLIILPFNHPTEKSKQDINLVNKLIDERSYIVK